MISLSCADICGEEDFRCLGQKEARTSRADGGILQAKEAGYSLDTIATRGIGPDRAVLTPGAAAIKKSARGIVAPLRPTLPTGSTITPYFLP